MRMLGPPSGRLALASRPTRLAERGGATLRPLAREASEAPPLCGALRAAPLRGEASAWPRAWLREEVERLETEWECCPPRPPSPPRPPPPLAFSSWLVRGVAGGGAALACWLARSISCSTSRRARRSSERDASSSRCSPSALCTACCAVAAACASRASHEAVSAARSSVSERNRISSNSAASNSSEVSRSASALASRSVASCSSWSAIARDISEARSATSAAWSEWSSRRAPASSVA